MAKGIVSGGLNGGGGSNIKSIQRGTATIANASASSPIIAIASVDLTKSIVRIQTSSASGQINSPADDIAEIHFLNNSQIQVSRVGINGALPFDWEVIEFNNVKSLQSGNTSYLSKTTLDIVISTIDTAKSMLFYSSKPATTVTNTKNNLRGTIKTSTTINFASSAQDTVYAQTIYWQVIEFN